MNARFWVYINSGYARITLRQGQSVTHYSGGPTDEGYNHKRERWSLNGMVIRHEVSIDACDCDGRITHHQEREAEISQLRAYPAYSAPDLRVPRWMVAGTYQRDYAAEAMGY